MVLAPTMEQHGLVTLAEMECETLIDRVIHDVSAQDSVVIGRAEIGAWTRV